MTRTVVIALIVLGGGLRTAQYVSQVSLWHDELAIVRNIENKGIVELLTRPLDHHQVAPAGFLGAVAVATRVIGIDELGTRLVSWLFSLASLLLFWRVAERFVSSLPLIAGVGLFAVSPALTLYGSSVKPYIVDVAVTLLFVLLALRYRERPSDRRRAWLAGAAGGAAIGLSYPAVLVGAGMAAVLWLEWRRTAVRRSSPLAAMIGCWAVGAAIAGTTALLVRDPATIAYMHQFWGERGGFPPPLLAHPLDALLWVPRQLFAVFAHFLLFVTAPELVALVAAPAAALAMVGIVARWRQDRWSTAVLVTPVIAGLAGAFAGQLPFRHRTGLYAGSVMLIAAMLGLQALAVSLSARRQWLATAVALLVGAPLTMIVLLAARPPYLTQESRPVLQELARRRDSAAPVYVYCGARHAVAFYGPRAGLAGWTQGGCHEDAKGFLRELDVFRGAPDLWLFFTQSHGDETVIIREYLRTIGRERDAIPDPAGYRGESETAAYLFDLSDPERLAQATADSFVRVQ